MINQRAIEQRDYAYIEKEMACIADFCRTHGIRDKAIVEMCKLKDDNSAKKEICEIANKVKPAFLKTSTGKSLSLIHIFVVDTAEYAIDGLDPEFRFIVSPMILTALVTERLASYYETYTKHNLAYRRYYRQFEY